MMTNAEITQREAEIQARIDAATPGEWEFLDLTDEGRGIVVATKSNGYTITIARTDNPRGVIMFSDIANAKFISHAKSDLIWQRKRIKELKAELEKCQNILASACDGYCPHCWRSGTDSCLQEC